MVLVGPFVVTSVSQGCYILTFIDEFSCYTWVYFSHHKNEVVDKPQDFKSHVEHQSRKSIKVLQMDNESRYVNTRLKDFCKIEVIHLQNPPTFSLHKKIVVPLRIQTLKSMESFMIQAKSLDPSLEVKAISSATHILN